MTRVGGRFVVQDGKLCGMEESVLEAAQKAVERIMDCRGSNHSIPGTGGALFFAAPYIGMR